MEAAFEPPARQLIALLPHREINPFDVAGPGSCRVLDAARTGNETFVTSGPFGHFRRIFLLCKR
jgi:hypothetical protein